MEKYTDLGFTKSKELVGTHMCLVFTDEEERVNSLLKFLLSGMQQEERAICFSELITEETIREYFMEHHISYDEYKENNCISISKTSEVYFQDNKFDPARMLKKLESYYNESMSMGFNACRVIGEMDSEVERIEGGDRLLEYESKVTLLLEDHPATCVCQYDANEFSGGLIMDILKVHPKMIVNGAVVENPFYIKPQKFLGIDA